MIEDILTQQWGSGIPRIYKEVREQGLPEPRIMEVGMRVRIVIPLALHIPIPAVVEQVKEPTHSWVESGVESDMARQILGFLKANSLSKSEIAQRLGKSKTTRYLNELMHRLLQSGRVAYTIPDKPNSRLQKYRLKGS